MLSAFQRRDHARRIGAGLITHACGFRCGLKLVLLADDQTHRLLLELLAKRSPFGRRFGLRLAHLSNLLWGPLSGPRRYPKTLGYRIIAERDVIAYNVWSISAQQKRFFS
jgi:hypothetical protein